MKNTTFPPVLTSLTNSISTEGRLHCWRLNSTLETYSLTIEWTRLSSCLGKNDSRQGSAFCYKSDQQIINGDNLPQNSVAFSKDSGNDIASQKLKDNDLRKTLETNERSDFHIRRLESPRTDENFKETLYLTITENVIYQNLRSLKTT